MIIQNQSMKTMQHWYTDTESFIVDMKSEDVYADLAEDIETRFDAL